MAFTAGFQLLLSTAAGPDMHLGFATSHCGHMFGAWSMTTLAGDIGEKVRDLLISELERRRMAFDAPLEVFLGRQVVQNVAKMLEIGSRSLSAESWCQAEPLIRPECGHAIFQSEWLLLPSLH